MGLKLETTLPKLIHLLILNKMVLFTT